MRYIIVGIEDHCEDCFTPDEWGECPIFGQKTTAPRERCPACREAEEKLDALMRAVGEVVESRLFKHRFDHASDSVEYALLMNNLSQALAALKKGE